MDYRKRRAILANLLKQTRLGLGLKQTQLARKLGKNQSFVSKYENGERTLDLFELWDISTALGVPLEKLVGTLREDMEGTE